MQVDNRSHEFTIERSGTWPKGEIFVGGASHTAHKALTDVQFLQRGET
jgi:hypothetical protein